MLHDPEQNITLHQMFSSIILVEVDEQYNYSVESDIYIVSYTFSIKHY